ncbi:MAG: decaprenyl-phosphate phosphoribosyltransferase [Candidatus Krumholzibacteriales bacterium]
MKKLVLIIVSMRPKQWIKNLLVLAGVVFARKFTAFPMIMRSLIGFALFCMMSGAVYILNDIFDRREDKEHPSKKHRPIPSGKLGVSAAALSASATILISLTAAYFMGLEFFLFAVFFLVVNLLYSLLLRKMVILDIMGISFSFLARAGAGVAILHPVAPDIEFSPWLWICTLFLSLFLAICKRRSEYFVLENAGLHRKALRQYSGHLLDQLVGLTATATLISYSIYTVWPRTVQEYGTMNLVFTIPFVVFGLMRYLYLVYNRMKGGDPSAVLLTEKQIMVDVFLWITVTLIIINSA